MQYYYGDKNLLRALDEAEFWMRQSAEHTDVIPAVTPNLEKDFSDMLKEFGGLFNNIHNNLVKCVESVVRSKGNPGAKLNGEITEWIEYSVKITEGFVTFLNDVLSASKAVKENATSQTVINHIIRESEYYAGIAQLILE